MKRNDLLKYLQQEYICDIDQPWEKYSDYVVIRRRDNQKWFAGIFTITGYKVGLDTNEPIDVVNLKCEPDLIPILIRESGIYPAYHMNKQHWISVDIESYEDIEKLKMLVDMSYQLVGHKQPNQLTVTILIFFLSSGSI